MRRDYTITRSYRNTFLFEIVIGAIEILIYFYISRTFTHVNSRDLHGAPSYFDFAVVGIIVTVVIGGTSNQLANRVRQEQLAGTLEALFLQPLTTLELALGMVAVPFLFAMVRAVAYLAFAGAKKGGWVYFAEVDGFVADATLATQRVRLHGKVDTEDFSSSAGRMTAQFNLLGHTRKLAVSYSGAIPDMFAPGRDVVIEGRDIGTVVAPNAEVKVYLNADAATRARRREAERPDIAGDALVTDLRRRDERDAPRLQPADDAEQIDTTVLEVDDVVSRIEDLVQQRLAASRP
jgi:cytochrome c-type biogenesis protein CcmE